MKLNPWAGRHPLAPSILQTKYLHINWQPSLVKYRRYKFKVNHSGRPLRSHGAYIQILALEISVWWR